jgi:Type IV pilin-like G and H, putative
MKIASSVAVLLIGSISSLLLTDTAQGLALPNNSSQSFAGKISIKPPVTLQVRQRQATDLINKLLKQQVIHAAEDNSLEFFKSFDELKIEPLTGRDTDELGGYKYTIETKGRSVVLHTATPQLPKLKAYFGLIYHYTGATQLQSFNTIFCESKKAQHKQRPIKITEIAISKDDMSCPTGYKKFMPLISPMER